MLDRDKIIREAIDRCLEEMYQKSQPHTSYYDYVARAKRGEIKKDEAIFERHYLNRKQFDYICNKYIKAFRLQNEWKDNISFLVDNLKEGSYKTVYKPLIEGGEPCRMAEKMPPIQDIIGEENAKKLFDYIEKVKNFYHFDREEETFSINLCLGVSPTSNPETVKKYWKSQGIDIEIDETELTEDEYWEIDQYGHLLKEKKE